MRAVIFPRTFVLAPLILVLAVVACAERSESRTAVSDTLDYEDIPSTDLQGRLVFDGTSLASPGPIEILGDDLFVVNSGADSLVMRVNVSNASAPRAFVREGEGPGEARSVYGIQVIPEAISNLPMLWLYDPGLRRATGIRLPLNDSSVKVEDIVEVGTEGLTTSLWWLNDSLAVGVGFYADGRLAFLNRQGEVVAYNGPLPPNPKEIPVSVLQQAYRGFITASPDGSHIVVVTRNAGQVEIYGGDGQLLRRFEGPFAFDPRIEVAEGTEGPIMGSGGDLRFGYLDVTGTSRYIYALFSGRTRRGYPNAAIYGDYIHVFDWDGNFMGAFHLKESAFAITADSQGERIYAASHNPRPMIISYDVPSLSR